MRRYWSYLKYLARHKWFVLVAGMSLNCGILRLLLHDLSKFRPSEFFPYARFFYKSDGSRQDAHTPEEQAAFDLAWLSHQHANPHHWQHWMLQMDSGDMQLMPMPVPIIREMVADWAGAGRAITGGWEVKGWFEKNSVKMHLHAKTWAHVALLLDVFDRRGKG